MIRMTVRVGLAFRLALCAFGVGCATTATKPRPATTETPTGTAVAPAVATPGDAKALLRASAEEVEKGHLAQARALLDQARPLVGADHELDLHATDVAVAIFTNQGDYEAAARVVLDAIRRRNGDRADAHLFLFHNWMAILREAQGDLPGAIVECAARTAVGYEGTWEPAE